MVIQRMFHNRQSQAAAARLPRTRFIDTVEAFGQTRNMLGSNPRTVILNAKLSAMRDTSPVVLEDGQREALSLWLAEHKEVLSTILKTGKLPSPQAVEKDAASKTKKQAA